MNIIRRGTAFVAAPAFSMPGTRIRILGRALDRPCSFVVCWTDDGSLDGQAGSAGGTGQALRIASRYGVPVFNLAIDDHRDRARHFAAAA